MESILKVAFYGFWHFVGFFFLMALIGHYLVLPVRLFFRHLNVRSKGWPPNHVDADGDSIKE